jgi:hypothetical protein
MRDSRFVAVRQQSRYFDTFLAERAERIRTIGKRVFADIDAGKIPLYDPADLDQWALSLLSGPVRSTSERRAARAESPWRADAQVASGQPQEALHRTPANLAPEAALKAKIVEADPEAKLATSNHNMRERLTSGKRLRFR